MANAFAGAGYVDSPGVMANDLAGASGWYHSDPGAMMIPGEDGRY
jgi:hypothetical protein